MFCFNREYCNDLSWGCFYYIMYVYIMFFVILMVVKFMCISITYLKLWKTLCNSMTQYNLKVNSFIVAYSINYVSSNVLTMQMCFNKP